LVKLGQTRCKTPEAFKAWSQNLGHESVLTTLYSYGEVGRQRQAEIMNTISIITDDSKESVSELSKIVAKALVEYGVKA
jgi:integrase/recombinase XerD